MIKTARRNDPQQPTSSTGKPFDSPISDHFREFCPVDSWAPAVNLYRLRQRLDVCVDLAGIESESVSVRVEADRLVIRGTRQAPEPPSRSLREMCILSMEIDHGPFCRIVSLPHQVDHVRVQIKYTRGLLWIRLPLRTDE